ncbi:MAG: transposase, partial [Hydrogenophaga sp.]|nr:transposase [Hydrogenophaga sp.]
MPLPTLVAALCGFRGGSMQSELDSFFAHKGGECSGAGLLRHVTDRALAKARSKLHVPALWALNAQLIQGMQDQGLLSLWKGRRLVCADATVL